MRNKCLIGFTHNKLKLPSAKKMYNQKYLIAMSFPFVIWVIIFSYVPLAGWIMAFQKYKPGTSFFSQKWVGLEHFYEFMTDSRFYEVIRNTLVIGGLNILFTFFFAILLAILINEVKNKYFKSMIQTLSYLPHFVSWVVVASIVYKLLSTDGGIVNNILMSNGTIEEAIPFMAKDNFFWGIITSANVWKEMGWFSILFLSAMSGIDQSLYEAAEVDGIGRMGKIWYITLPSISPTIAILLIMAIGGIMTTWAGFDPSYLLGNSVTKTYSDTLAVYAYRYGLEMNRYSLSTAIGIFNSIISLILVFWANKIGSKALDQPLL